MRRYRDAVPTQNAIDAALETARTAYSRGDGLLQLQLVAGALSGDESAWGSSDNAIIGDGGVGWVLDRVEQVGWRLEQTGFAFVQTGASSSARLFATGEGTVNRGEIVGYYVFRRSEPQV